MCARTRARAHTHGMKTPRPKERQKDGMNPTLGRALGHRSCSSWSPEDRTEQQQMWKERGRFPLFLGEPQPLFKAQLGRRTLALTLYPSPSASRKCFLGCPRVPGRGWMPTWLLWKSLNPAFMKHVARGLRPVCVPWGWRRRGGGCRPGLGLQLFLSLQHLCHPILGCPQSPGKGTEYECCGWACVYVCVHACVCVCLGAEYLSPKHQQTK